MTPRQKFLTEVWLEGSKRSVIRMVELSDKAQDSGLDGAELAEYEGMLAEKQRLFREYVIDIRST